MWRLIALLIVVLVVTVIGTSLVLAQDSIIGRFSTFVIDVEQAVPVEVTIPVTLENGDVVTATAPLTVSVALRVKVDGPDQAVVELMNEPAATVEVATATPAVKREVNTDDPIGAFVVASWEEGQAIELEGVTLTLNRVALVDWEALKDSDDEGAAAFVERITGFTNVYDDIVLLGIIDVEVTNQNEETYAVSPSSMANVVIGSEQIGLDRFIWGTTPDLNGDVLPGVVKEGTVAFGTQRTQLDDVVDDMPFVVQIKRPTKENFYQGEEDFVFKGEMLRR